MLKSSCGALLSGSALLLTLVGCHHYGYQPYGYGYGPTYAPQPQYYGPSGGYPAGGTYVPQTITPASPTPITPTPNSGTSPTPTWRPNTTNENNAPTFNRNPDDPGRVPPARDLGDDFPGNPGASRAPTTNNATAGLPTFERGGLAAAAPPAVTAEIVPSGNRVVSEDPFGATSPARLPTDLDSQPMPPNAAKPLNPYEFDRQGYKWLRGVIDYDDLTQTWSIVYNLTPDATDPYAGSLIVSPHPDLGQLQRGDIVLLEGRIDQKLKDRTGKPIYTITKVQLLAEPSR